ncbi:MAG TPA: type II toxin-antitoxin system HipA family toxin [Bacteroidales bacterium]|nr:type II toxin-antitoxin system HipA family toxin [Bacteroidales bacterium]
MIKTVDILKVKYNEITVGRLVLNRENLAVFEYDIDWLKSGFSVSPIHLPLTSESFIAKRNPFNGLFGVFNDSLPDGWGNLLLDRLLKEKGINPLELSVLDRLSIVGKNGMGALSYEPESMKLDPSVDFDLDFFAAETMKILQSQDSDAVETLYKDNGSSGGARPKVLIKHENEEWMVKFRSSFDPENIGEIEYNTSIWAKKCGIEMPETKLFEGKYFGVKLFDRTENKRIHVHTASGLLYADHRLPALDYDDLLKLTRYITGDLSEVEKMLRLMIFNIVIGNKDDHAKNFSFIYKNDKWKLSPAYDLTPNFGFNGNHSTTILGKGNPDEKDIFELGKRHGFEKRFISSLIEEFRSILRT